MDPKQKSCGFGKTFNSFYKPGAVNSLYLTRPIRNCESLVYGEKIIRSPFRFGKKNIFKLIKSVKSDINYLK